MFATLLTAFLKAKFDEQRARLTEVGQSVTLKGVAHGIKLFGSRWEIDCVLRRTK